MATSLERLSLSYLRHAEALSHAPRHQSAFRIGRKDGNWPACRTRTREARQRPGCRRAGAARGTQGWQGPLERHFGQKTQTIGPESRTSKVAEKVRYLTSAQFSFDSSTVCVVKGAVPPAEMPPPDSEWPVHFPPNCPDSDAIPTDGTFFRLLCGDETDWKSAKEQEKFLNHPECIRAGLSCFLEREQVAELRDVSPQLSEHKIARGNLTPEHGKIKPNGNRPGHHCLWLRTQFLERATDLFHVIE
jgi:hypothetical protein